MHPTIRVVSVMALTPMALMAFAGRAVAGPLVGPSWPIALTGSTQTGQYGPNLLDSLNQPQYFAATSSFSGTGVSRTGLLVLFKASTNIVDSAGTPGGGGLWTWHGANSKVMQITDTPAFGGVGTYTTGGVSSYATNSAGQLFFRDSSSPSGAIYANPGTPGRLIKALDIASGTGSATFASFGNNQCINASGNVATLAGLTNNTGSPTVVTATGNTQNSNGFWGGRPGALSLLVRQNDQANTPTPGNVAVPIPAANVFVGVPDSGTFSYNDSGKLAFVGTVQGTGVTTVGVNGLAGNNQALMSTRYGYAEIVAQRGGSFPDATGATFTSGTSTDGVALRTISTGTGLDMNDSGRVVFSSTLRTATNLAPTTGGTAALFSDIGNAALSITAGTMHTVARDTTNLPAMSGLPTGLKWGSAFSQAVVNSANTIAFTNPGMTGTDPATGLTVTSSANAGVFKVDSAGVYTKVLRTGDAAPAWPAAVGNPALNQSIANAAPVFSGTPSALALNSQGQMAFVNGLGGVGISTGLTGNQTGLFAMDSDGTIYLVAQKGMLFHVGPGDDRIVSGVGNISNGGNADGHVSNLDDLGNLAFTLSFSDTVGGSATSSGVFYFHIPSPGSAALLGMGGLLAAVVVAADHTPSRIVEESISSSGTTSAGAD